MNPAIPALAKAAVGALIKGDPSGLAIAAAQDAVGELLKWLPAGEKSKLDRLTAQVERELDAFIRSERIGSDLEPALGNATILFEAHGLNATELVDCGLAEPVPRLEQSRGDRPVADKTSARPDDRRFMIHERMLAGRLKWAGSWPCGLGAELLPLTARYVEVARRPSKTCHRPQR